MLSWRCSAFLCPILDPSNNPTLKKIIKISPKVIIQFVPDATVTRKLQLVGFGVAWSFARTKQEGRDISIQPCLVVSAPEVLCPAQLLLCY